MRAQAFLDALSRLQRRHGLLLFLALGAALFAVDALRRAPESPGAPQGEGAAAAQWLEDEVLYREALARGLDAGDPVVRRRLVQKMRLLLETSVDVAEPDQAEVRAWIDADPGRYGGIARVDLDHVFLSRSLRGAALGAQAEALAAMLRSGGAAPASDPHPAGADLRGADARQLDRLFGEALAAELARLPQGEWRGPLRSALGLHLVRIHARELRAPDYAAVADRARRDLLLERRREATRLALGELKARYGVQSP